MREGKVLLGFYMKTLSNHLFPQIIRNIIRHAVTCSLEQVLTQTKWQLLKKFCSLSLSYLRVFPFTLFLFTLISLFLSLTLKTSPSSLLHKTAVFSFAFPLRSILSHYYISGLFSIPRPLSPHPRPALKMCSLKLESQKNKTRFRPVLKSFTWVLSFGYSIMFNLDLYFQILYSTKTKVLLNLWV